MVYFSTYLFETMFFQTGYGEGCMMEYRIYAGTYAGADENGIFRYRMDGNSQILERELALPGI